MNFLIFIMERRYRLLLLLILVLPQITAGSVSISPAYFIEHFEPGLEKSFGFNTFNSNKEDGIGIGLYLIDTLMMRYGKFDIIEDKEEFKEYAIPETYSGAVVKLVFNKNQ